MLPIYMQHKEYISAPPFGVNARKSAPEKLTVLFSPKYYNNLQNFLTFDCSFTMDENHESSTVVGRRLIVQKRWKYNYATMSIY